MNQPNHQDKTSTEDHQKAQNGLDWLVLRLMAHINEPKEDLEKNLRALLSEAISRMDLVTAQEMRRQQQSLANAQKQIMELQEKIDQLANKNT